MTRDHCLATYGTLAPGRANHHQLAGIGGRWLAGVVKGRLFASGWGAALGYAALVPDESGDEIAVYLLVSDQLPDHWLRLDAFEGSDYRRREITVQTTDGPFDAWIYMDASA